MAKPTMKKFLISFFSSILQVPQLKYCIHWAGPRRHIPGRHCTPCPLCDGKIVYGEPDGLPYWRARRLQHRITGPWDETSLVPCTNKENL